MTYIQILNDVHLCDKAPVNCTDSYIDDLFDLLEQTVGVAERFDAYTVFAGDVFHLKQPSRNSHALVQRMIELIQKYPNTVYIVPGNHDLCVSEDTEALTNEGWKFLDELTGTEMFAVLDEHTREMVWERPSKIHVSHRTGSMILFHNTRVNHLVTPGHSLYVRTRSSYSGCYNFSKKLAKDAPSYPYWQGVVAAGGWTGSETAIVIPDSRSGRCRGRQLDASKSAELFGWYLSEGSTEQWRTTISQSVDVHPEFYAEISSLLKDMGFRPLESSKYIRVGNTALSEYLSTEFGSGSYDKKIPQWVKNWPKHLLEKLMSSLLKGDAHKQSDNNYVLTTASDALIDDVQEICIKLGWRANATSRMVFPVNDGGSYVGTARRLHITKNPYTLLPEPEEIEYSGKVWCPDLGGKIWLSRREGKPIWTGNSNDRLDSIPSQPLGVLFKSGAYQLKGWDQIGLPLYGVPWLQRFTDSNVTEALQQYREDHSRYEHALVVTHAPLYPPGKELSYEFYPSQAWADAMNNTGSVAYGHVHDYHGVWESGGVQFCNNGALSRGSLTEHNRTRKIYTTVWSSINGSFRAIELKHKKAEEVFKIEQVDRKKEAQVKLDDFLAAIGQTTIEITSVSAVMDYVMSLGIEQGLVSLVRELLEEVTEQ